MKRFALTLEISSPTGPVLGAVRHLTRDPRLSVSLRIARALDEPPRGRTLRIEPASTIRPLLSLLWGEDTRAVGGDDDLRIALSPAAWEATTWEAWRWTAAPLPRNARWGAPDRTRPWLLTDHGVESDLDQIRHFTALPDPQLHHAHLCLHRLRKGDVRWLPTLRTRQSLLGHVDAVWARNGPLAWDASRAGTRVFAPYPSEQLQALAERRLKRLIPGTLGCQPEFWQKIAVELASGCFEEWGTARWLLLARQVDRAKRSSRDAGWKALRIRRKLLKLRRDPQAFWDDSWLKVALSRNALCASSRKRTTVVRGARALRRTEQEEA